MRPNSRYCDSDPDKRIVILHCHGNATDLGFMMACYLDLAENLGVEVFGVEYSGFGPGPSGTGKGSGKEERGPSFRDVTSDALAAYRYLTESERVKPSRIIFYGQSVGSGPMTELSTMVECAGLVLHSPLLSGIRVLDPDPKGLCKPSSMFMCFDIFRNFSHIRRSKARSILLIHGKQDQVVPFAHSETLLELIPLGQRVIPYFPLDAGHNDVVDANPLRYFQVVREFITKVTDGIGKKNQIFPSSIVQL